MNFIYGSANMTYKFLGFCPVSRETDLLIQYPGENHHEETECLFVNGYIGMRPPVSAGAGG
jgi:hypothetical protein